MFHTLDVINHGACAGIPVRTSDGFHSRWVSADSHKLSPFGPVGIVRLRFEVRQGPRDRNAPLGRFSRPPKESFKLIWRQELQLLLDGLEYWRKSDGLQDVEPNVHDASHTHDRPFFFFF